MNDYKKAVEVFDTTFDDNRYFETLSSEYTKNFLIKAIENNSSLIFLLGKSGVGKTYMLNLLRKNFIKDKKIIFASEPFATPESFCYFLLKDEFLEKDLNISELKSKVIDYFKGVSHLIIIDEAQLLNDNVFEFIRILSDTNHFSFLFSMHQDDGEELLKKAHFLSREHKVVRLELLKKHEIKKYIESELLMNGLGDMIDFFRKRDIAYISKLSNGNFRVVKQILKHIFLIIDYATINSYKKYTKPSSCVITMAGIDLGIIDA